MFFSLHITKRDLLGEMGQDERQEVLPSVALTVGGEAGPLAADLRLSEVSLCQI
jgi:hypothetical protein